MGSDPREPPQYALTPEEFRLRELALDLDKALIAFAEVT